MSLIVALIILILLSKILPKLLSCLGAILIMAIFCVLHYF